MSDLAPIGVFDSGSGGLTVLRALTAAMPAQPFIYYGDHAHLPYGNLARDEIKQLTQQAAEALFQQGCRLVILACNTATAVALQWLQREWLPHSSYAGTHNVLGIIVPLVEAITDQDWYQHQTIANAAAAPPQTIMLFATPRTVASQVFETELHKRAPHIQLVSEAVSQLVTLIESNAPAAQRQAVVRQAVKQAMQRCLQPPTAALLGCTHYPLALKDFQTALPNNCTIYDQPAITAQRLANYLETHQKYLQPLSRQAIAPKLYRAPIDLEQAFSPSIQIYSTKPWQQSQWLMAYSKAA